MTKIAAWNVNSVKARLEHLLVWLKEASPDVVLLQETKTQCETFPREYIEDLGYNIATSGQKSYNGVAILSKHPIEDVVKCLPGDDQDLQARYIEAVTNNIRVVSVYVPNGQDLGTEKFAYKMAFYDRLHSHMQSLLDYDEAIVVGGDYNVALEDIDTHDPVKCVNRILCYPEERNKLRALMNLGYYDIFRSLKPEAKEYSWWDYRAGSWQGNKGYRIDYLLLSPQAVDRTLDTGIDTSPRGKKTPSDHTPVWCTIGPEKMQINQLPEVYKN